MPQPLPDVLAEVRALLLDPDRLTRAVGSGRRHGEPPPTRAGVPLRRVELRPVDLAAGRRLQVVELDEQQAFTTNHAYGAAATAAVEGLLAQPFGHWRVEAVDGTVQLRVTKRGEAQVHRGPAAETTVGSTGHDRAKHRLLDPGHPVLAALGLTDQVGRVKPSRQDKYRQVEELLRQLDVLLPDLLDATPADRPLRVVDLGCGNAYLTLAGYAFLVERLAAAGRGRAAELLGVDVRERARRRNTRIVTELGWTDRVRFEAAVIDDPGLDPGGEVDVVLALHACDTATDDALARAVGWRARAVLAAPCCHHDLQRQLAGTAGQPRGRVPDPYQPVARHGLLRERFADVLTDALRAEILREVGYRVAVVEFVDSRHTPRNALLRGFRTDAGADPERSAQWRALAAGWGVRPALADRLRLLP